MMARRLGMAVLLMHLIVVALAIPVTSAVLGADSRPLVAIVVMQVLAVGALRSPFGSKLGWTVEGAAVVVSYNNTTLLILNLLFLVIWYYSQKIGNRIDRDRAALDPDA